MTIKRSIISLFGFFICPKEISSFVLPPRDFSIIDSSLQGRSFRKASRLRTNVGDKNLTPSDIFGCNFGTDSLKKKKILSTYGNYNDLEHKRTSCLLTSDGYTYQGESVLKEKLTNILKVLNKRKNQLLALIQSNIFVRLFGKYCVVRNGQDSYIRPWIQLIIALILYVFHMVVLTQHAMPFPMQLIPNDKGWFLSIGYDSLAGIAVLVAYSLVSLIRSSATTKESGASLKRSPSTSLPPLLEEPFYDNLPWNVTTYRAEAWRMLSSKEKIKRNETKVSEGEFHQVINKGMSKENNATITLSSENLEVLEEIEEIEESAKFTGLFLVIGYTLTGQCASMCEGFLYCLAGLGVPMTIAMHRSLVVLISHLCWVFAGSAILSTDLYPSFFGSTSTISRKAARQFRQRRLWPWQREPDQSSLEEDNQKSKVKSKKRRRRPPFWTNTTSEWFTNKINTSWVWWAIGGYYVSSWFFNISDIINQQFLPSSVFENSGEGVVAQLINPEKNDIWASLVGYIAPCLSAPIWEELLYRGYMLPAISLFIPFWPAVFTSGFLFSIHHMSTTGFIPLWVLGMIWAALYAKCKNLWVTILIHAMWNSRVFLGSWLGL